MTMGRTHLCGRRWLHRWLPDWLCSICGGYRPPLVGHDPTYGPKCWCL